VHERQCEFSEFLSVFCYYRHLSANFYITFDDYTPIKAYRRVSMCGVHTCLQARHVSIVTTDVSIADNSDKNVTVHCSTVLCVTAKCNNHTALWDLGNSFNALDVTIWQTWVRTVEQNTDTELTQPYIEGSGT